MTLTALTDAELLSGLHSLVAQGHVLLARLLAYLGEVEERRLHLEAACPSMFDFCVRRLGMSEDEACRRIAAARLARRFPVALAMIEGGDLHLTTLGLLGDHLTSDNHEDLLRAACGKTKREVQELIAARFPRPDAPALISPLPMTAQAQAGAPIATPAPELRPMTARSAVEPLSVDRYKVQFTASTELREKIERASELMRHSNPSGDLEVLMHRAVDLLVAKLEKERLARTTKPARKTQKSARRGYVPKRTVREVLERDGAQCTFIDERGRRCPSRDFLQLDHAQPRALGGGDEATNLRPLCASHNRLMAEKVFGRDHVEKRIASRRAARRHPRQRGSERESVTRDASDPRGMWAMASKALTTMGFREPDARRALGQVRERIEDDEPPIEVVLREALAVLG